MEQKCYVQAFYVKDREIILDNLPKELYDNIQQQMPDFYERIDQKVWVSEITSPDGIKFYVIISRTKESITEFMNAVLFAQKVLIEGE